MTEEAMSQKTRLLSLPRNVWAMSLTSFFMDVSSEMVINILPLFLRDAGPRCSGIDGLVVAVPQRITQICP